MSIEPKVTIPDYGEPWTVSEYSNADEIRSRDGSLCVFIFSEHGEVRDKRCSYISYRILDCVHALRGLNPAAVPDLLAIVEDCARPVPDEILTGSQYTDWLIRNRNKTKIAAEAALTKARKLK
jgi:hypothetical protein